MRILSYESLLESWIQHRELKKIILLGNKIGSDKEGFLFDEPMALIEKAAQSNDVMCFFVVLSCYEPCDIEDYNGVKLKEPFKGIFNEYKESRLNAVQKKIAESILPITPRSLFF